MRHTPIRGLLLLVLCAFLGGCGEQHIERYQGIAMDTVVELTVVGRRDMKDAVRHAVATLYDYEHRLNVYAPDSAISRVNAQAADAPVPVDEDLYGLIEEALAVSGESAGAFDVTVGPLVSLWRIDRTAPVAQLPAPEALRAAMRLVGREKIVLDPRARTVRFSASGVKMDLSGIAKGFIVDKIVESLKRDGVTNALINAGGDLYCLGAGTDGKGWKVGVQHPAGPVALIGTLRVRDRAVVTSGDYERFVMINGRRYSHLLDPRTGYPIRHTLRGVTVIADTCTRADALATACMVLGPERGPVFLGECAGTEGIFVEENAPGDYTVLPTKGVRNFERTHGR